MAYPFFNKEFTFTQPDGTKFQAIGRGNQIYATFETASGHTIIRNSEDGFYSYAALDPITNRLVPTSYIVGTVDLKDIDLKPHLRESPEVVANKKLLIEQTEPKNQWRKRFDAKRHRYRGPNSNVSPLDFNYELGTAVGIVVGLCIPIEFPDAISNFTRNDVDAFCNQLGYNQFGNNGSVKDYFLDVSLQKLNYSNIVTPMYMAKHPRHYYTDESIPFPNRAVELINEAISYFETKEFDFSNLTTDEDNCAYALNVFYAGPLENSWKKGLWPHQSALVEPILLRNDIFLHDYQMTNMGESLKIGTFCHESGHLVCSFPDYYDYDQDSFGSGVFCLMAFGGTADELNPVEPCAYLKYLAGWQGNTFALNDGDMITLSSGQNDMAFFTRSDQEFYVIEHRSNTFRDKALPSSGIAIWHIDTAMDTNDFQWGHSTYHYQCSLIQADGKKHLENNENIGDSNDLFGRNGFGRFPNQSNGVTNNWWDGTPSGLTLKQITSNVNGSTFMVET